MGGNISCHNLVLCCDSDCMSVYLVERIHALVELRVQCFFSDFLKLITSDGVRKYRNLIPRLYFFKH